ncbi:MAG: aminofutalosine synthase MqnE [Nitrospirae bacterium RBG_16_43_8]|nr:MAG: aminofutalosine synthase MqnE [Nitrospirae bacterium RBG_16_43_8]
MQGIKDKILSGKRLAKEEAIGLFESDDIFTLGDLASHAAKKRNGNKAYFIRNIHINPTNICVNRCKFCAFSRSKGEEGAYEMTLDEIIHKLLTFNSQLSTPFSEVHVVGGLHPDWPFGYYLEMLSSIKKHFPKLQIKAFTATEIEYMSRISGKSVFDTLTALRKHGLDTMPGGGAEIFDSGVRNQLCPEKLSSEGWLNVIETAHKSGIKTNATMLYGHVESYEQRVDHLMRLRELQDRTGGFQAFIPLAYHPKNTEIGGLYSSGIDDLKTIAVSRLVLDNFDHIKAYWIMLGEKLSQLALLFGADDIDGTIIEEKITHSAGALSGRAMTAEQLKNLIMKAGKIPVERDSFYKELKVRS